MSAKGRSLREKTTPRPRDLGLSFSFKHLAESDDLFGVAHCSPNWFKSLIERMRDLGTWTVAELTKPTGNESLRCHPIEWEKSTRKTGFGIKFLEDLEEEPIYKPWQLSVSQAMGRVHGYFVENTFFVVWLDPNHRLFPMPKYQQSRKEIGASKRAVTVAVLVEEDRASRAFIATSPDLPNLQKVRESEESVLDDFIREAHYEIVLMDDDLFSPRFRAHPVEIEIDEN